MATWPQPNYIDPETRGPALFVVSILLIILGAIIISIRTYTRLRITRAFGLDDGLAILAYLLTVALTILVVIGNKVYYSGRHVWDVPPNTWIPHRRSVWWCELVYIFASSSIRISVLLFYRRLSIGFANNFLRATYIGLAMNVLYMIGFTVFLFIVCIPLDAYWNALNPAWASTHNFQCLSENISLPLSSAVSTGIDLYATLVPICLIATIQRCKKDKIALYFIFSAGFLVVVFGILRTIYGYRVLNTTYDYTWVVWDNWLYTLLELYTAILAASAPSLRPLISYCVETSRNQSKRISRAITGSKLHTSDIGKNHSTGTSNATAGPVDSKNPLKDAKELENRSDHTVTDSKSSMVRESKHWTDDAYSSTGSPTLAHFPVTEPEDAWTTADRST
ncbi:hypothetical protein LTS08_007874 [Lithohypha guttulata]|nr:hypothetical protein LTS08_007874 [Lithohypha guttulata]